MFENKLYIDSNDAYTSYGAVLGEGSYEGLLTWAQFKEITFNDWHEEHGIEPDLSDPKLDTRTFDLQFNFIGSQSKMDSFILQLSNLSYHAFIFVDISLSLNLRMVSVTSLEITSGMQILKVKFAHDEPLEMTRDNTYSSTVITSEAYQIDSEPLTSYGITVLEGSLSSIKKAPDVKENLTRNISILNGAIYQNSDVKYKAKDITLKCLLRAQTVYELINNYLNFYHSITEAGTKSLYVDATGETYDCYYNSNKVTTIFTTGKLWLEFDLVLTIPNPTVQLEEFLLSTENGLFITTEDGLNHINMEA